MWVRARLNELWQDVRDSYWFVPSLLALLGFGCGLLLVYVDALAGDRWLGQFEWFYGSRPEGARALLSTVAGSTITVAGVVFSITLAAVTYASGQYGPRLLSTFIRDRGNQVTLGVFIGTFLYCLVVLRTIRSAEEASADTGGALREAFVPHFAMFGAMALAITSIGVLIYFVHHVTDGIHINNVIARIGRELLDDIRAQKDERRSAGPQDECRASTSPFFDVAEVPARSTGYIEAIDESALLSLAAERKVRFRLLVLPGDFVHAGETLLRAEAPAGEELNACDGLFSIGRKRSSQQDLRFAIDELVEVAARALSPGVNDPFTAIAAIDWLGAALREFADLPPQAEALCDEGGEPRLVRRRLAFADYLASAIGQLRPYAVKDANAGRHLCKTLQRLADDLPCGEEQRLVAQELASVRSELTDKRNDLHGVT